VHAKCYSIWKSGPPVHDVQGHFGIRLRVMPVQIKTQARDSFENLAQHQFESQAFICLISSNAGNENADL
jgi:hypothetical protein